MQKDTGEILRNIQKIRYYVKNIAIRGKYMKIKNLIELI